jgi:hypothetical protein
MVVHITTGSPTEEQKWRSDFMKNLLHMIGQLLPTLSLLRKFSLLFLFFFLSIFALRNKYSLVIGKVTTIGCWVSGILNLVLGYSILMGIWTILVGFLIAIWELPVVFFWFSKVFPLPFILGFLDFFVD